MSVIKKENAISPTDRFKVELFQQLPKLKSNLPASIDPTRFAAAIMIAVQNTPALLNCSRDSLFTSISKCAQDGLLPDGREAAIISYGNIATYQSMVYGVIKRIKNSGEYSTVFAEVVFPEDKWEYYADHTGKHFRHVPDLTADRTDDRIIFAYAVVTEKDNDEINIDVMNRAEIEKTRAVSKSSNGPGWKNWWGEMAKKTVLRRLSKRVSMTSEFDKFVKGFDEDIDLNKKPEPKASTSTDDFSFETHGAPIEVESAPVQDEEPKEWEVEAAKMDTRIVK